MIERHIQNILENVLQCTYYFVELESYDLSYISDTGCSLLGISHQEYKGKKCYELLYNRTTPCEFCNNAQLKPGEFIPHHVTQGALMSLPHRQSTAVTHQGKHFRLELVLPTLQTVPSLHKMAEKPTFDQAMVQCASVLLHDDDMSLSLNELAQITGSFYCGDRSYLAEFSEKNQTFKLLCRCDCNENFNSHQPEPTEIPLEYFQQWSQEFQEGREVLVSSVADQVDPNSSFAQFLKNRGVDSLLIAPIHRGNNIIALLSVVNPTISLLDVRLIRSMVVFVQECLQKRDMLRQLQKIHEKDALTGCFNHRKYLLHLMELGQNPPESLGILFVDLNSTKEKNKEEGFYFGDETIKIAADLMQSLFSHPFYRVDTTQFLCFVPTISQEDFQLKIEQLREKSTENPTATFSVGYSWEKGQHQVLEQLENVEHLIQLGTHPQQEEESPESVQKDLLKAIEAKEFQIYFQPKVQLSDRKVVGAEALVRRKMTREDTLVYPGIFVQLYEDQAIIRYLDLYVVEHVCKTLSRWLEEGIAVPISVNFSRVTLTEYGIVETISDICKIYNVPHNLLLIEFTERIAMMNESVYFNLAKEFRNQGFLLSLDDFGAAYSNLITLANIEIDEIKIDESLVINMEQEPKTQIILKSIVEMCETLDNTISLAEGIETEFQAKKLLEFGCVYGQGNLFSPPIPEESFYQQFLK